MFQEFKFVEARIVESSVTLAVVTRYKREPFTVGKKAIKFCPAVDNRVCFNFRASTFKVNTGLSLEVS